MNLVMRMSLSLVDFGGQTSRDWWPEAGGSGLNGGEGDDECRLGSETDEYRGGSCLQSGGEDITGEALTWASLQEQSRGAAESAGRSEWGLQGWTEFTVLLQLVLHEGVWGIQDLFESVFHKPTSISAMKTAVSSTQGS